MKLEPSEGSRSWIPVESKLEQEVKAELVGTDLLFSGILARK